jgi:hypothetical protein
MVILFWRSTTARNENVYMAEYLNHSPNDSRNAAWHLAGGAQLLKPA